MEPCRLIRRDLAALGCLAVLALVVSSGGRVMAQGMSGGFATNALATVTVYVDTTYCASGGDQCTATGNTQAAAGTANKNPVRIVIHVAVPNEAGLLTPLLSLNPDLFTVSNAFVPAYGPLITRESCSDCSQSGNDGSYAIFVQPSGNWVIGSYFVQVRYETGGQVLYPVLVQIFIAS